MAYNTTTQTTGNLKRDDWVTKEERHLSFARRQADRFAITEALAELQDDGDWESDFDTWSREIQELNLEDLAEPDCYCRRCYLHDDPAGCLWQ